MKKIVLFLFAILLVCPYESFGAFYQSDWAKEALQQANEYGLLSEKEMVWNTTESISRREIVSLLLRAYENAAQTEAPKAESPFADATDAEIGSVYALGIMHGTGESEFSPGEFATREEISKIILTFQAAVTGEPVELPEVPDVPFDDFSLVSDWAKPYVAKAYAQGIVRGYDDGNFYGKRTVSREEAIALLVRSAPMTKGIVPVIATPQRDAIVSSEETMTVAFQQTGNYRLYAYTADGYGTVWQMGSCKEQNFIRVAREKLQKNMLYYLFAEQNGVFSEFVPVYTDSYGLFLLGDRFPNSGTVTLWWNQLPADEPYRLTMIQKRNSRHEGDIAPDAPLTEEFSDQTSYSFTAYPKRTYQVELVSGEHRAQAEFYVKAVSTPGADEIRAAFPQTKEEADALMTKISVPVWKLKQNGTKVSSEATLTVHSMITERVKLVFEEIYHGPEQFPVKDIGGYAFRGGKSEHNSGTAIDLNYNENYCIYNDGTTVGEYWKPYEDPYSVTPYGDVVNAFEKYGFTWGGDAWSNPRDYMHFSYLGT